MNADRGEREVNEREQTVTDETSRSDRVSTVDKQETNEFRSRATDKMTEQNGEMLESEDDWRWSGVDDRDEISTPPGWTQSSDPSSEDEDEEMVSTSGYVLLPQDAELTNRDERSSTSERGVNARSCSSERRVNARSCSSERRVNDKSSCSERRVNDKSSSSSERRVNDKSSCSERRVNDTTSSAIVEDRTQQPRMTKWLQKQVNDDITTTVATTNTTTTALSSMDRDGGWAKFNDTTPSSDSQDWPHITSTVPATTAADCVVPTSTMREGRYIQYYQLSHFLTLTPPPPPPSSHR